MSQQQTVGEPTRELRIDAVMVRDRSRLRSFARSNDERFEAELARAEARVAMRLAAVPTLTYPEQLPVSERRADILNALRSSQVVVLAGDTGSGKSTQLPKLLLESGRGIRGLIGHTQPRRLAARTIAERIAEELGETLGDAVGFAVRFDDRVSEGTLIKVMTDGILLAELNRDRDLTAYDAIIIDEAHERSLNIDFLLGYLHQLRARRPDLQIVITSATIDTQRFAEHFAAGGQAAPIIEVSGRTYPVEIRYRPFGDDPEASVDDDRDQVQAIADAVDELCTEGPGDILVFLSGEREIRDTADALTGAATGRFDVLPLYARLSSADQHRIFAKHNGRRVVLATNVAETSLTVPGIRYVIDAGMARISRYSRRLKVQRLPIEAISQASANQRTGRCGRVAPGIAIRLFGEESFESREAFTDPEILRTNLASVLLRMASIKLGSIEGFPFVEPPDRRTVKDGVLLLEELGAFRPGEGDADKRLTPLGRRLASLPVDPRLGRMILEADRLGCTNEVLIIVSALSIQDPRERPRESPAKADELHRRFADLQSDFLTWLNLWDHVKQMQKELSGSQFRRRCRGEYLNFIRLREWQDVHAQLRSSLHQAGVSMGARGAHGDAVHRALLSGLLSQMGVREAPPKEIKRATGAETRRRPMTTYLGARNARFTIAPGSVLARKGPAWVMAGELVETNQLWARSVAGIEPAWAEELGGHLCVSSWSEPRFDERQGAAVITQRVTLYGLTIVPSRTVQLSRLDPPLARELFIRHGLAEGKWTGHHRLLQDLTDAKAMLAELATRARRSDIEVAEDRLEQLFTQRLPLDVLSAKTFDKWWKQHRLEHPDALRFTPEELQRPGTTPITRADFPDEWTQDSIRLKLTYLYDPLDEADGVTVHIPLHHLDRLHADDFDWHIPGHRHELLTALCRTLPKDLRKELGPAPDAAREVLNRVEAVHGTPKGPFVERVVDALTWLSGLETRADDLSLSTLPDHLRLMFSVEREDGQVVAVARDFRELQRRLRRRTTAALGEVFGDLKSPVATTWEFGELAESVERSHNGVLVVGYPALSESGATGVAAHIFSTRAQALRSHHTAVRRLLVANLTVPMKQLLRAVGSTPAIALALDRHGSMAAVLDDCVDAAIDQLVGSRAADVRSATAFAALRERVRDSVFDIALGLAKTAGQILQRVGTVETRIDAMNAPAVAHAVADVGIQVDRLILPGFVVLTGAGRMPDLIRYLDAVLFRLDGLGANPQRDRERTAGIAVLERRYEDLLAILPLDRITAEVGEIRWMLEELRIGMFAQQLGTKGRVSEKRILEAIMKYTS